MRLFSIVVCLLAGACSSAQTLTKRTYEGLINGKIPVVLTLTQDGNSLFGTVVYKKKSIPITAAGRMTQGTMHIIELMNDGQVTGMYSVERKGDSWTGIWGGPGRDSKDYKLTLKETAKTNVSRQSLPDVTGTYRYSYGEESAAGEVMVFQMSPGLIAISVNAHNGGPAYNMAMIQKTDVPLKGNKAIYANDEYGPCKLQFTFGDNVLEVDYLDEAYECGFGHSASAAGSYIRTNASKPTFEDNR